MPIVSSHYSFLSFQNSLFLIYNPKWTLVSGDLIFILQWVHPYLIYVIFLEILSPPLPQITATTPPPPSSTPIPIEEDLTILPYATTITTETAPTTTTNPPVTATNTTTATATATTASTTAPVTPTVIASLRYIKPSRTPSSSTTTTTTTTSSSSRRETDPQQSPPATPTAAPEDVLYVQRILSLEYCEICTKIKRQNGSEEYNETQ